MQRVLALILTCLSHAHATGPTSEHRGPTPHILTTLVTHAQPNNASALDPLFECAWRKLAFEYAQKIQPKLSVAAFQDIHDGLELGTQCGQAFALPARGPGAPPQPVPPADLSQRPAPATTLYVDYAAGSDSNPGSQAQPLQHITAAVALARTLPQPALLYLRAGVHRLSATVELGAGDSGLTIAAFPGEAPVVTSGLVIKPSWKPVQGLLRTPPRAPAAPAAALGQPRAAAGTATRTLTSAPTAPGGCNWTVFPGEDAMFDDWPNPNVINTSTAAGYAACQARCQGYAPKPCNAWVYYSPTGGFGPSWDGQCFLRTDSVWAPSAQENTWSGGCFAPPPPPQHFLR